MQRISIPILHAEPCAGQVDEPTLLKLIRQQGRVPGILLSRGSEQDILSLDTEEVDQVTKHNSYPVLRIHIHDQIVWARVSDFARDTYKENIWHVEMTRLPKGEVVVVDVPVEVLRKSAKRWADAPVQQMESIRIEGPVEMLPNVLEIDARHLKPNESIRVGELELPRSCEPVDVTPDTPVVSVLPRSIPAGTKKGTKTA
jgi:large subunit ribosomal protein L25